MSADSSQQELRSHRHESPAGKKIINKKGKVSSTGRLATTWHRRADESRVEERFALQELRYEKSSDST